MRGIRIAAIAIVGVFIGGVILLKSLTTYVEVGFVGVRTQEYGIFGSQGVVQQDFRPGWHRDLGPIDSWRFFESTIQTLEMTRDPSRGSVRGRDDVRIQSADGYTVSVDVTVKYRIQEGMAHKLYEDTGSKEKYKVIVRNEAEKACLALFGQMKTEDFYNPEVRRSRQDEVKRKLADSLTDNYVEVIDVLMRDVMFDPEYEKKIQRRKLADQEVELNKSMAKAEGMRGKTQIIEAETQKILAVIKQEKESELVKMKARTDAQIAEISAEAERYATKKTADANLEKAQKEAEGQLEVKKAEAEGEKLRNRAMMGVGGSTIVALEAAKNLNLSEVTISTVATDVLDIDDMATKLGAQKATE